MHYPTDSIIHTMTHHTMSECFYPRATCCSFINVILVFRHFGYKKKEGKCFVFNDALNTFYLWLYDVSHMVKDHSDRREETRCHHIGYSFRLAARVLLYASSHRQDNTYHSLCYTSRGALAGKRNSSMGGYKKKAAS